MSETALDILDRAGFASLGPEELADWPGSAKEPTFAAFVAGWCEVSLAAAPAIAGFAKRLGDKARFVQVDVDRCALDAERLGVRSVPAVLLFAKGREPARRVGAASEEELVAFAEEALEELRQAEADSKEVP